MPERELVGVRRSKRSRQLLNYDEHMKLPEENSDQDSSDDALSGSQSPKPRKGRSKRQRTQSKTSSLKAWKAGPAVSNIDEVQDFEENPLFEALSTEDISITELAQSWLDDFIKDDLNTKFEALKEFLNLILRCAGCVSQLNHHDVTNTDSAKETISEIQILFGRQKFHECPMMYAPVGGKKEDWKTFPTNARNFFNEIILIAGERGVLYDNEGFADLLLEWIGAMSTSNIRALRYCATVFGLKMQSALCYLSVNVAKFVDKYQRQLKKENDSLHDIVENIKKSRNTKKQIDTIGERIKQIEKNIEIYKHQKEYLDNLIVDFFNTLFTHRYRDISSDIRLECVKCLGEWMEEYPAMFFESIYLRYLGWLLTDKESIVRTEVFKVLTKLYKQRVTVSALRQFTSYFKTKLIDIVIYETDFRARYHCLQLLNEVTERNYLEDDEMIKICSLIFVDNEDSIYQFKGSKSNTTKLIKEIAKYVLIVEKIKLDEVIERDESIINETDGLIPLNAKEMLKFKLLIGLLDESYEYYLNHYSTNKNKKLLQNSKFEKTATICQYIYQFKRYNLNNKNFELLFEYLTFDISSVQELSENSKKLIELDSSEETILLNLLLGATTIYAEGASNTFYKCLFPHPQSGTDSYDKDYYLTKVMTVMPKLVDYFDIDIDKISILILLTNLLITTKSFVSANQINSLDETTKLLFKLLVNINIGETDTKIKDSRYYESIVHGYCTLLKLLPFEQLKTTGIYLNDLVVNFGIQIKDCIKSKNPLIISHLNKLNILSKCPSLNESVRTELQPTISTIIKMTEIYLREDNEYEELQFTDNKILSMLCCTTDYVNDSFKMLYQSKLKKQTLIPEEIDDITKSVQAILNNLGSLITPDDLTIRLTMPIVYNIALHYLDISLCIAAYSAESKALTGNSAGIGSPNSETQETNDFLSKVPFKVTKQLVKLFCIKEYQYVECKGLEDKLERDENEDVNFSKYLIDQKDEDENEREKNLENDVCELSAKLGVGVVVGIIDASCGTRIKLNGGLIGDLYVSILHQVGFLESDETIAKKGNLVQSTLNVEKRGKKRSIESDNEEAEEEEDDEEVENIDEEEEGGGEDGNAGGAHESEQNKSQDQKLNRFEKGFTAEEVKEDEFEFSDIDEDDDVKKRNNLSDEDDEILDDSEFSSIVVSQTTNSQVI